MGGFIGLIQQDFILDRVERKDGHEDYWFTTSVVADKYLCHKYMEQGCEHVFEVVYSKDEDIVGVKRQFRFNYDVIIVRDNELKSILISIINGGKN